jgi:hypothetical protein
VSTPSIRRERHEERRPRPFIASSGLGDLAVCPGGVFAVGGVVAEAAVQDADESVSQGAEGLVVQVAGGAVLVVEGACSGTCGERAEGPAVDGVVEAPVADVAGQHGAFLTGGDG